MESGKVVVEYRTRRGEKARERRVTIQLEGRRRQAAVVVIVTALAGAIAWAFVTSRLEKPTHPAPIERSAPVPPHYPEVDPVGMQPPNPGDRAAASTPQPRYDISLHALGDVTVRVGAESALAPSASAPIAVAVTPRPPEGWAVFALLDWGSRYVGIGPATPSSADSTLYTFEPIPLRAAGVLNATSVSVHVFIASRRLSPIDEATLGMSRTLARSEFRIQVPAPTLLLSEICGDPASSRSAPTCEQLTLAGPGAHLLNDGSEKVCIEARSVVAPSQPPLVLHGDANGNQWSAVADATEPPPIGPYTFRFGLLRSDDNDQDCGSSPKTLPLRAVPQLHHPRALR